MNCPSRKLYVGIDVHSKMHKVAILPRDILDSSVPPWKKAILLNITNTASDFESLHEAIKSYVGTSKEVAVAVDHTGGHYSEAIVNFLQKIGYIVYHLESKALKAARERFLDQESKTDTIDACGSAYLLYLRDVHGISFRISAATPHLESKASILRSLVLQRWQFNKLMTQATNRLHQYLIAVFPEGEAQYFNQLLNVVSKYPLPSDIFKSKGLKGVDSIPVKDRHDIVRLARKTVGVPGDAYRWLIRELSLQRKEYARERDAITAMIHQEVTAHPYWNILESFPYLGEISAATIIGVIEDISRWPDKKKFKKALGIYNSLTQSGKSLTRTKRGREGSREGRRALFLVCFGCVTRRAPDNDFKDYYQRLVDRGKPRMKALVATSGKLAEIIYHCLKTGEKYSYQGKNRFAK